MKFARIILYDLIHYDLILWASLESFQTPKISKPPKDPKDLKSPKHLFPDCTSFHNPVYLND